MVSEATREETLALWFSNYASLATKALRPKLAASFGGAAQALEVQARKPVPAPVASPDKVQRLLVIDALVKDCVATAYPGLEEAAGTNRGALRAFTWGNKVATILKSVLGRVSSKGDAVLAEGQSFYVCDACGFIYIGAEPPAICPVCKAPPERFAAY